MHEMSDSPNDQPALNDIDTYEERAFGMLQAFDDAQFAVLNLQTVARDPSMGAQQRYAAELLSLLVDQVTPPVSEQPEPDSPHYRRLCALSDGVNWWAERACARLTPVREPNPGLKWFASFTWFACAVGAAVAMAAHQWTWAILLLSARIGGAIVLGTSDFPADTWARDRRGESGRSRIERCLLSHAGDVAVSLGVSAALLRAGRDGWALFAATAACVTLLGSLGRVGVIQVGVRLGRRKAERIARRFPAMAALVLTATLQPSLDGGRMPYLALATFGSLAYALLELYCVHQRLGDSTGVSVYRRRFQQPPQLIYEWSADQSRGELVDQTP